VKRFEALARHPLAIAGAVITTASAAVFIALVIAVFAGLFENPYAGLVIFLAIPAVFMVGLLMMPAGMWLEQRRLRRDPSAPADWPVVDFRHPVVRRRVLLLVALTGVNIVIILLAGYGGLHAMESPQFCGQACHTPMHPQFTAWGNGAHARVACVSCHIGEGPKAFVHAKLAGVRQLMHVVTGSYPRPVPPGAHMPPGAQAQTCLGCHQPQRTIGDRVRVFREYADDEQNTENVSVLEMNMGGPSSEGRSIHWHANPAVHIEYVATSDDRQTIPYVKVTDAKGNVKEYFAANTTEQTIAGSARRSMDCIDCHNAVGHPISPTPEKAVDRAIASGSVSRQLPFVRREGVRLLTATYPSQDAAVEGIAKGLKDFYASHGGPIDQQAVDRAASALQDAYRGNVFPTMKVGFGAYPHNEMHIDSPGCVRCHDDEHKAKDGSAINGDCEFCHKQKDT
jgi:nitrate/TMAO reductase-like tetraheme cytochrome c subunit